MSKIYNTVKRKKKERVNLPVSKKQIHYIENVLSWNLGIALGLLFTIHNQFFLGFVIPILIIAIGNWLIFKFSSKSDYEKIQIIFKFWGSLVFSTVIFQFFFHNAFSFAYQLSLVLTLIAVWITYKIYKGKKK